ncbi:threonine/serine exporter family protein, partial [Ruminococcaceae bacterium OttesenSCG-928-I18]|nr:threonine/serine exporter family protein [Ruminococcaceae bacterium OttesenSCG-928-I18]
IMLTIYDEEEKPYTVMKRIHHRDTNLAKVDAVNRVSRNVAKGGQSLEATHRALQEIEKTPPLGLGPLLLASSLACGAFTLLFVGEVTDCLCGLCTGAALRLVLYGISKLDLGFFFVNLTGGAVSALASWLFFKVGLASDWNILTIATLMLLVPGLLFTNAFRDIVAGDLVSGISRAFETFAIAVALACGAAISYAVILVLQGVV